LAAFWHPHRSIATRSRGISSLGADKVDHLTIVRSREHHRPPRPRKSGVELDSRLKFWGSSNRTGAFRSCFLSGSWPRCPKVSDWAAPLEDLEPNLQCNHLPENVTIHTRVRYIPSSIGPYIRQDISLDYRLPFCFFGSNVARLVPIEKISVRPSGSPIDGPGILG
jgi:hypothetical protein